MNAKAEGKWLIVGRDRFEDEGDPYYRINDTEYESEKDAEEAARKYLSDPTRKRYGGGDDDVYVVGPDGKKKLVKGK